MKTLEPYLSSDQKSGRRAWLQGLHGKKASFLAEKLASFKAVV